MKKIGKILSVLLVAFIMVGVLAPVTMAKGPKDIYSIVDLASDVNADSGEFSILIAALQAADPSIIEALDGKGQYTVFAPTDAAFVDLLDELDVSAEALLDDEELINQVLLYHVLRGRRYAMDILDSDRIRTMEGGFLFQDMGELTDENGRMSNIVATDIEADNGIIHVIDTVVLPK